MSYPKIGDRVSFSTKKRSGTGMVVKIWKKRGYVGWNVKTDGGEIVVGIPSYAITKL